MSALVLEDVQHALAILDGSFPCSGPSARRSTAMASLRRALLRLDTEAPPCDCGRAYAALDAEYSAIANGPVEPTFDQWWQRLERIQAQQWDYWRTGHLADCACARGGAQTAGAADRSAA